MTDARLPAHWLSDVRFARLSPDAGWLYVTALLLAVSNRTDGVLYEDQLEVLPRRVPLDRVDELVKADLWRRDGDRLLIVDFVQTQTSSDELQVLDQMRARAAARKRAQRLREKASRDVSRDQTGEARQGQERQGQAPKESTTEEWP